MSRRVHTFSYFMSPRDTTRDVKAFQRRDDAAAMQILSALVGLGFEPGESILNPPPPKEVSHKILLQVDMDQVTSEDLRPEALGGKEKEQPPVPEYVSEEAMPNGTVPSRERANGNGRGNGANVTAKLERGFSVADKGTEVKVKPQASAVAMTLDHHAKKVIEARLMGYEGDPCGECGQFTLVRNGTCLKCVTCGSTTGCS